MHQVELPYMLLRLGARNKVRSSGAEQIIFFFRTRSEVLTCHQ